MDCPRAARPRLPLERLFPRCHNSVFGPCCRGIMAVTPLIRRAETAGLNCWPRGIRTSPMISRDPVKLPRSLFERFRAPPGGQSVPSLLSSLQAYGGLQAFAARAHRPAQSLGRMGSLEVRLAQTAAEVRQAQKLRYRVFYQEGSAIPNPGRLFARRDVDAYDADLRSSSGARSRRARDASDQSSSGRRHLSPAAATARRGLRRLLHRKRIRHRRPDRAPRQSAVPRTRPLLRAGAVPQQAASRAALARHLRLHRAIPHRRYDRLRQPRRHRAAATGDAAVVPASLCPRAGAMACAGAAAGAMSK